MIGGFALILVGCKPEIPDNCEGQYSFKRPYITSHPLGVAKVGETITIEISLPMDDYNYSSDSIVNISRFNKILFGFNVDQLLPDSTNPTGVGTFGAKNEFNYSSPNVRLDFTEGVGGRNRVRFYLRRDENKFVALINITPLKKGMFLIGLLSGLIEDAFCKADVFCYWGNFTPIMNLEKFGSYSEFRLPNFLRDEWLKESAAYFILVE
jgi:hypothetical protein